MLRVRFAELVKAQTAPRALIIHAPVHNTPVFLTGRRSLMGYPGHIWTHGLNLCNVKARSSASTSAHLTLSS
jgi:hypothetical protein